jgi:hypothetical protein
MAFSTYGQKITWNPNVTPDAQKKNGGWYDDPSTGFNRQWFTGDSSSSNPTQTVNNSPAAVAQTPNVVQSAQQLQDFYKTQNQPAINTLQSQYNPSTGGGALVDKYNALLDSIKQGSQVAANTQTVTTNNEMAARGILPSSGAAQQNLTNALLPVGATYGGLTAQAGLSQQQDLGNIAAQIASLQSGNPSAAINTASGLAQLQQAADIAKMQYQNIPLSPGQTLYNQITGSTSAGSQFTPTPMFTGNTGYTTGNSNVSSGQDYTSVLDNIANSLNGVWSTNGLFNSSNSSVLR